MKTFFMTIFMALALAASGEGITTAEVNGVMHTNITGVSVIAGGKIMVRYPGGGASTTPNQLPADFLESWGIGADKVAGAKAAAAAVADANLDKAIRNGFFREVDGVIYDIRKPLAGWVTFANVKVIQITDDGAIADTTPDNYSIVPIYIFNLSRSVGDTDFITFSAKPVGSHSYINKRGDMRTIRAYDVGRVCSREEIPEPVLSGGVAFAAVEISGKKGKDVIAALPDGDKLYASGSGFFISEDGFLITNHHVVKKARRISIKTGDGVFPAKVLRVDATNDLALLKVTGHFHALPIGTNDVQLGDPVFTIGFPDIDLQGMEPKYTDGKISSLTGIQDDPTEYQISVPVQPGNSGGPLVDKEGTVAGVIVARLNELAALRSMGSLPQNVNYAVKGPILREFLAHSPEYKPISPTPMPAGNSSVPAVKQAVAIVLVY